MTDAVIIDTVRTPIGKRGGSLKDVRPDDLAAHVLRAIVERTGIKPALIEDVILGCNTQTDEQGMNIARVAALVAGFPETVPGTTVTRMCGSGQQAVNFGAMEVLTGTSDLVIGGGVESMSRVPMGSDMGALNDKLLARYEVVPQGISADLIADKYGITREQMDELSLWSHRKAIKAIDEGRFKDEIVPVPVLDEAGNKKLFDTDEHPRRNTSLEKLASLPAAFKADGRITAGTSSGINDGAAAVLVTTDTKAAELGLRPRARIVAMAQVGVDPILMLEGPIPVTRKILPKAGLDIDDIDLWEINEAFASVVVATINTLGIDGSKVNVNGGAIALGHPLGASGARLMTTLLNEMEKRKVRYGLSTLCIGFGQGIATILERLG
ncbi:MAG: acetyl-CoA acetyltransferase [Euryarchaeota archaeon RBG_16_68_12]|nr:MAG: acetyl-CoA acetyltransferase [Euryarchaeota archaeon RBG_16_68_12]